MHTIVQTMSGITSTREGETHCGHVPILFGNAPRRHWKWGREGFVHGHTVYAKIRPQWSSWGSGGAIRGLHEDNNMSIWQGSSCHDQRANTSGVIITMDTVDGRQERAWQTPMI